MTLSELRDLVLLNLGSRTDKNTLIDAQINAGYRQAVQRHAFKGLTTESDLTLTSGVSAVTLPVTAHQIVELRLIDGTASTPLKLLSKVVATRNLPNPDSYNTGIPQWAYEENGTLYVLPRPSQAFTVRGTFLAVAETLTADSDEPVVVGLENALVAYATSKVFGSLQMYEDAQFWNGTYESELQSAITADKRKPAVQYQREAHPGPDSPQLGYGDVLAGHIRRRY